ncbi:MAG: type II toxin-antitoxin system prevent-host-death family antitoxin [Candidatus Sericytochromatia bacterium]|nr:type II toxin-antitoxin system prevent-host-death family antitoxin [Candidatus Tanganyikabacteria bacterium]
MTKKLRTIPAGEFKAKVLALLDEVAATGQTIVVTKRGRAVAQVSPVAEAPRGGLEGSIVYQGDVVSPVLPPLE